MPMIGCVGPTLLAAEFAESLGLALKPVFHGVSSRLPLAGLVDLFGSSEDVIRQMATDFDMSVKETVWRRGPEKSRYSGAHRRILVFLWNQGVRVAGIADALGRSISSIYGQAKLLGLSANLPRPRSSLTNILPTVPFDQPSPAIVPAPEVVVVPEPAKASINTASSLPPPANEDKPARNFKLPIPAHLRGFDKPSSDKAFRAFFTALHPNVLFAVRRSVWLATEKKRYVVRAGDIEEFVQETMVDIVAQLFGHTKRDLTPRWNRYNPEFGLEFCIWVLDTAKKVAYQETVRKFGKEVKLRQNQSRSETLDSMGDSDDNTFTGTMDALIAHDHGMVAECDAITRRAEDVTEVNGALSFARSLSDRSKASPKVYAKGHDLRMPAARLACAISEAILQGDDSLDQMRRRAEHELGHRVSRNAMEKIMGDYRNIMAEYCTHGSDHILARYS